jgi:hypothetical protein
VRALGVCLAMACLLAVAGCGGSSKDDCGDVANKIYTCSEGTEDKAEIQAQCEALTCDDKQGAIDCVMALTCSASMEDEAYACLYDHGCNVPVIRQ